MLSFVLITSVLNILLGVGIALLVMPRAPRPTEQEQSPAIVPETPPASSLEHAREPIKFVMEDLTPAWLEKLASESVQAKSLVEASSLVLRLEVGRYRENLVVWEDRLREMPESQFASGLREPIAAIVRLNEDWLKIQSDAVNLLSGKSANLDQFKSISERLEEILLGQTSQIESTANNLLQLRLTDPPAELRMTVLREIQRLIDLAHLLRDAIHSTLLAILIADQRVESAEKKLATDAQTDLLSPVGLEAEFGQWKRGDDTGKKVACIGVLGFDQFKALNERLGTRRADALLAAASRLCADTIRKDRGFDRIARLSGDTLAIFYGDTSIRSCVTAMERLRQTLAQSSFDLEGEVVTLTGSCALASQARTASTSQTLQKAVAAIKIAKLKAREQIVIDEGNGPEIVDPPKLVVRPIKVSVAVTQEKAGS